LFYEDFLNSIIDVVIGASVYLQGYFILFFIFFFYKLQGGERREKKNKKRK
jgi:hypothetical protein